MKSKLLPHQELAVSKAMPHRGFALFMEQRTGKTKTALAIAEKRGVKRLLIRWQ